MQLDDGGFQVCNIASPFIKCPIWAEDPAGPEVAEAREWAILERSFEIAHYFGAPMVRTFSFLRVSDPMNARQICLEVISEALRRTQAAGLKLVLENEHACNLATGRETGWLLERITSPNFGITWDPGNEAAIGSQPYPDGYDHVRGRIFHVHLKDTVWPHHGSASWRTVGEGVIDYLAQFRALAADNYDGLFALEPHYEHPIGGKAQAARDSFTAVTNLLGKAGINWRM